mgnify:CR=1 FL=1
MESKGSSEAIMLTANACFKDITMIKKIPNTDEVGVAIHKLSNTSLFDKINR